MADPINLTRARKNKARADRDCQAAENRARHGRTRAEKSREADDIARAAMTLDSRRLDNAD